jgi:hypothetical protein
MLVNQVNKEHPGLTDKMEHQELKDQWDQPEIMVLNKLN